MAETTKVHSLSTTPQGGGDDFGSRLRAFRKRYGLTLRKVSEATGITSFSISRLESTPGRFPNPIHLVALVVGLSKVTGMGVEEVMRELSLPPEKEEVFRHHYQILSSLFSPPIPIVEEALNS